MELAEYHFANPRWDAELQNAAMAVVVAAVLLAVALAIDSISWAPIDVTGPAVVFGALGFFFSRLVTDLIEANKRGALALQLGDLLDDKGKLSPKGRTVTEVLKAVRKAGPIRISSATTLAGALSETARTASLPAALRPAQIQDGQSGPGLPAEGSDGVATEPS